MAKNSEKRILVVDDEPFVCDAVKMMLAFDGHQVETVNNGQEALAVFEKGKFDVIITDYCMPVMRGDELAVAIKAIDPKQPVLLITAYAETLGVPNRDLPGIDYLLSKPFMLEDLREALVKITSQSGAGQDKGGTVARG